MNDTPQLRIDGGSFGPRKGRYALAAIALVALAASACILCLEQGPALSDHEAINAQSARQTLESGRWLIPQVGEVTRVRKTPLGIWSIAAATWLTGAGDERPVSEFSARLPAAIAAVLNALAIWWLGTMLFGRRAGLVAGCVMACCVATVYYGRNAQVDMLLTLFTTLSFACFWKGAMQPKPSPLFMLLFYAALAAAMMAKAPLPMVTVGFALAVYWFVAVPLLTATERTEGALSKRAGTAILAQVSGLWRLWLIPGLLLFVFLAGAWPWYVYKHVPNALDLWRIEYLSRYSGELSTKTQPPYYYIMMAFGLTVPFMLSLPEAVAAVFLRRYREHRTGLAFALTWAIVGTVFLSTASYKRPHYLLSVLPAYCLLLAPVVDRLFFGQITPKRWLVWLACAGVPLGLGVALAIGPRILREDFPDLQAVFLTATWALWGLWSAAALCFAAGRRTASFVLLCAWVLVMSLVVWPGLGKAMRGEPEMLALVKGLEEHGVGKDDRLYWVEGRPNSTIEFYWGYRPQRLIDELEMTRIREKRSEVSNDLLKVVADRIKQELNRPEPVYLILPCGYYELMLRETSIKAKKVFELSGFNDPDYPGNELAVITQLPRGTPEQR